jgi:hypothetical protein
MPNRRAFHSGVVKALTHSPSPANWSLSELVYAIVLMAHFHAFSSFIESCVLMETTYKAGGPAKPDFWPRPASRHNSGSANSKQCSGSVTI